MYSFDPPPDNSEPRCPVCGAYLNEEECVPGPHNDERELTGELFFPEEDPDYLECK